MNLKKIAVTASVAGAVGGFAALGLGVGAVQADPKFPAPPVPPVPAPPIPHMNVPRVEVPHAPDVKLPPGQVPPAPRVNVPPVEVPRAPHVNLPPGQVPPLPDVKLPPLKVPTADVDLPDVLPNVPNIDDYFGLRGEHIPPGQLKNSAIIHGVKNPFFGIPPGQLKKMRTVQGFENPFFDEAPRHWEVPEWGVPDVWPGVPEVDDFFGLPGEQLRPEELTNSATVNGVRNPFFGIPRDELRKLPTVQGFENPFFDETPGHWDIP